jgi:cell division septation protein DedD
MEAPLKQRLIGAIVLAALALIFVPMLLKSPDVKDPDSADVPLRIPDEVDSDGIKTIEIPLDGSAPIVSTPKPSSQPVPALPEPVEAPSDAPGVPSAAPETAAITAAGQYAVVISAKNDAEAKAISAGLLKQGLSSKIQSNGQLFRVRIGPYASREQAELARLRSTAVVTGGTVVAMDAEAKPVAADTPALKPAAAAAPAVAAATASAAAATKPEIKPEVASGAKGFAVQIGAPASEAAAIGLRDKARAAGFNSFIQPVESETGRRYRVRIGPEHTRDEAKQLLLTVKQKLGVDGIVVTHP